MTLFNSTSLSSIGGRRLPIYGVLLLALGMPRPAAAWPFILLMGRPVPAAISPTQTFNTCQVQVSLDMPPPVRLRLALERTSIEASTQGGDSDHEEIEWDPSQSMRLTRTVVLGAGTWTASVLSDTLAPPDQADADSTFVLRFPNSREFSVNTANDCASSTPPEEVKGTFELMKKVAEPRRPDVGAEHSHFGVTISFRFAPLPDLESVRSQWATIPHTSSEGRAFTTDATHVANDVLQLLGEIAIERAQSKALEIVADRVRTALCVDLKFNDETATEIFGSSSGRENTPILPRSCDLVQHVRIADLAGAVRGIFDAVGEDLATLGTSYALTKIDARKTDAHAPAGLREAVTVLKPVLRRALQLALDAVSKRTPLSGMEPQALLIELSHQSFTALADNGTNSAETRLAACGFDLAFAVMVRCQGMQSCDARTIADLVYHADKVFKLGHCLDSWKSLTREDESALLIWPDLQRFIARGVEIANPPKGTTPRMEARAAVELAFDVTERFICNGPASRCAATNEDAKVVGHIRTLMLGVIDREIQAVVSSAASLLEIAFANKTGKNKGAAIALQKTTALLAAIANYSTSYSVTDGADAKAVAARREARKKAIEQLIDASTDRRQRDGDWVVSLGALVGFTPIGMQYLANPQLQLSAGTAMPAARENSLQPQYAQLTLPMGVAIQKLPVTSKPRDEKLGTVCGRWFGFHAQLSVVDLGQFIAFDKNQQVAEVDWSNFLMIGHQAGFIFGTPSNSFFFGTDIRYAPTLFSGPRLALSDGPNPMLVPQASKSGGAFRFGVLLAYYVPFFDFN